MKLIIILITGLSWGQNLQPTGAWNAPLRVVSLATSNPVPSTAMTGNTLLVASGTTTAWTIAQAGTTGFEAAKWFEVSNTGSGALTITATTSTFSGCGSSGSVLTVQAGSSAKITSDGTNYAVSGCGGTGTVTHTPGALTSAAIVTGNGGGDIQTPASTSTLDSSGNMSLAGKLTSGTGCSGCAGALDLPQGTDPGSWPSNTFSLFSPTSIGTSYRWQVPAADSLGFIRSSGAGTPGVLTIVGETGTGNVVRAGSPTLTGTATVANLTITGSCTGCGGAGGAITTTTAFPLGGGNGGSGRYASTWNVEPSGADLYHAYNTPDTGFWVIDLVYDASAEKYATYSTIMPSNWDSGTAVNFLVSTATQAPSAAVYRYGIASRCGFTDYYSAPPAWNTIGYIASPISTATYAVTTTTISTVAMTGCAAGALVQFKISRDNTVASNSTDGLLVFGVAMQWTSH